MGEGTQPMMGPTGMTFPLERLRLAHLCREMADIVPLETSELMQMPYEQIIALDNKLQEFLSSLPFFFKFDAESRRRSKSLEIMYPNIVVSRYCITAETHSRRCKLHQRLLLRQSVDPRYAYSRLACLDSARVVVRSFKDLRDQDSQSTSPELMGIAVHFTHLALVVMAMDLCFNRDEANAAEIKEEVKAALQMFEDARNASPLPSRFLSSLSDVLRKYNVHLMDPLAFTTSDMADSPHDHLLDAFSNPSEHDQSEPSHFELDMQDPNLPLDTSFEEFWQIAMQGETNPDSITWDNLFSTLDSRPL